MRDPERLSSGRDATAFERSLVDAARGERLPDELKQRIERGLGLVGGTTIAAAAAHTGALAGKGLGAKAGLKVGTVAAASAGVVVLGLCGAVVGLRLFGAGDPAPAPRRAAGAAVVALGGPVTAGSSTVEAQHTPLLPLAAPRPAVAATYDVRRVVEAPSARHALTPRTAAVADSLRAEIDLIDAARTSLQEGSPTRALQILRRYDARFPRGTLAPEAVALRVEALMRAGRAGDARALARRFVAAHPTSPLAARIQILAPL